ncbi:hypothetical protein [Aurantiacibacter zhengii]|nr:hypothetical protein [Aurantiacibacter zhengii]
MLYIDGLRIIFGPRAHIAVTDTAKVAIAASSRTDIATFGVP